MSACVHCVVDVLSVVAQIHGGASVYVNYSAIIVAQIHGASSVYVYYSAIRPKSSSTLSASFALESRIKPFINIFIGKLFYSLCTELESRSRQLPKENSI